MRWTTPLTLLAVLALAFIGIGGLWRLTGALSTTAAIATVALLVVVMVVTVLGGSRDSGGPRTPYW